VVSRSAYPNRQTVPTAGLLFSSTQTQTLHYTALHCTRCIECTARNYLTHLLANGETGNREPQLLIVHLTPPPLLASFAIFISLPQPNRVLLVILTHTRVYLLSYNQFSHFSFRVYLPPKPLLSCRNSAVQQSSLQYYCTPGWPVIPFRAHPPPPGSVQFSSVQYGAVAAVSLLGIIHHTISVTHPPLCFTVQKIVGPGSDSGYPATS
jgi:hypothetical protein